MENIPLIERIRVTIALAVVTVIFAWSYITPDMPGDPLIIAFHRGSVSIFVTLALLAAVSPLVGWLVGRDLRLAVAVAAVPAGLTTWAIMGGTVKRIIMEAPSAADRVSLCHEFMLDLLFWSLIAGLGCIVTLIVFRKNRSADGPGRSASPIRPEPGKVHRKRKGGLDAWFARPAVMGVLSGVGVIILAVLLLNLLLQSDQSWVSGAQEEVRAMTIPQKGQVIFAVAAAFFLATLGVHQVTRSSLWCFLAGPLVTGLIAYGSAGWMSVWQPFAGTGAAFVNPSAKLALVLPIIYIGVGLLGVISGHVISERWIRSRSSSSPYGAVTH